MALTKFHLLAFICLVSSIALVTSIDTFSIQGRVYCDTCRAGFETNITEYIPGAKVRVECTHFLTNKVEHSNEGVTDSSGSYKITVSNDHADEICEVVLVESPQENCMEIEKGRDRAQVLLANDGGISGNTRHANSLGFLRNEPLPFCAQLLQEYFGQGEED
ncbi:pollen-specific protein C13-like [Phalaenopsis equestris]|uniref:pollen-specific protein C13-like n=1 Tax=Phalaenopsis equestris TaxID=78828 RepID=UPI0009E51412|nr:pollen-specific protein C13-like [Phalaenopsis equestris]